VYLGDGHITHQPRTFRLEIYLNAKETRVIRQTVDAIQRVLPRNRVGFRYRPSVVIANSYSQQWADAVPAARAGSQASRADCP
jgi:hypothetical protein